MHSEHKPLKFLFIATFRDGSEIRQTPEDKSSIEPEKRSQFFDVLQREDELLRFEMTDGKDTFSVNLDDAHFEVNGTPFYLHGDTALADPRIIFWRKHRHEIQQADGAELSHEVAYEIGFQASGPDGKNIQHTIVFA